MHRHIERMEHLLMTLLSVLLLTACEREGAEEQRTSLHVTTMMAGTANTRTTSTSLQSTALDTRNTAGIFAFLAGETSVTDGFGYENLAYAYINGAWKHAAIYFPVIETEKLDIYVYAPRLSSISSLNNIPVTVATDQTAEVDYLTSDFVFGNVKNVENPGDNTAKNVSVTLYHAMSKVILNIQDKDGVTSTLGQLSKVEIGSERFPVMTDAYINITKSISSNSDLTSTAAILTGGTPGIVTLMDVSSTDLQFSMAGILPPQQLGGGNNLTLYFDNGGQISTFEGTISQTLRAGYAYTFTVVIDQSELTILSASIVPWATTESVSKVLN